MLIRKILIVIVTISFALLVKLNNLGKDFVIYTNERHIPNKITKTYIKTTSSTTGYGSITAVSNLVIKLQSEGYEIVAINKSDMTIDFALTNKSTNVSVRVYYDWSDFSIFWVSSDYTSSFDLVEYMRGRK